MKKFYYLAAGIVTILVTIIACEKSAIGVDETLTVKDDVLLSRPLPKVDVCHYDDGWVDAVWVDGIEVEKAHQGVPQWITINISENALEAHLNHGDNLDADGDGFNVCDDCDDNIPAYSPLGDYTFVKTNENSLTHDYEIHILTFDVDTRELTGVGSRGIYNLVITGEVDTSGILNMHLAQDDNNTNCWDLSGTVLMCGGIDFIQVDANIRGGEDCNGRLQTFALD